jgi:hypothetical protein
MAGSRTLKLSILGDVDGLNKSLKTATTDMDTFGDKIGKVSKVAAAALATAATAAAGFAVKIGVEAVKAATDLQETISKVGVLFGKTSKDIEKFAEGAASSLGQTKQQALNAAATFATFGKAAGLTGQDLSKFSIDFVKLSSDLASFNNTSPEQAINAIGSALRGEAEPLRQYGVLLDDASLRQAALELGIISTTKNALTPQQKVLAAQALIYKQTSAAQGDFERTSDGLANKTRILTAQLENAKTTIGTALLPIVTQLATLFADTVIPVVEKFAKSFDFVKYDEFGASLGKIGTVLKNTVLPIFNGAKDVFNNVKDAIIDSKDEFESFFDVVKFFAPKIGTVIGGALSVVGEIAGAVVTLFGKVLGLIKPIVNTAIDAINLVIKGINLIKPGTDISYIPKIGDIPTVAGFSGTMPSGKTFNTGTGTERNLTSDLGTIPSIPAGGGGLTGVTPGVSGGISSAAKAASDADNGLNLASYPRAGNYAASGFPTGEVASTTINVTVNGALNAEGTARTIVDTLNNSFYRGTGGASNLQFS